MTETSLLRGFYTVANRQVLDDHTFSCEIAFNAGHGIFKGHFEQMPVVPGVCQTQIITELLQEALSVKLRMVTGDSIKFMGMIVPEQHPVVQVEISYQAAGNESAMVTAEARIYKDALTFTKFKGTYTKL